MEEEGRGREERRGASENGGKGRGAKGMLTWFTTCKKRAGGGESLSVMVWPGHRLLDLQGGP